MLQVIKDELGEIRAKFADPRRTELASTAHDLDVEDLIAEEDMVVTITKAGYVKRLPVATYRQQKRGGKGVAGRQPQGERLRRDLFIASTHDYVLFFSTKGKVYRMKVHELPVGSRHARGTAAVNLLPFEQDEKIAAAITTRDFSADDFLLFATRDGMVKKTALQAYDRSRRDGIIAIALQGGGRAHLRAPREVRHEGDDGLGLRQGDQVGRRPGAPDGPRHHGRPWHERAQADEDYVLGHGDRPAGQRAVRRDRARLRQAHARRRVPDAEPRRHGCEDDPGDGRRRARSPA